MSKTGFLCPNCNSEYNRYIYGGTSIVCDTCGYEWDPGDDDEDNNVAFSCPRCGSDDLDIYDDGEFCCNDCGLEGDIEDIEDIED